MRHKQKVQFSTNCSQGIGHFLTDSQSTIRNFTVSNVISLHHFFSFSSSACVVAFHATDKVNIGNFPSANSKPSSSPCLPLALGHILVVVSVLWRPFLPTLTQFLPTHKTQEEFCYFLASCQPRNYTNIND